MSRHALLCLLLLACSKNAAAPAEEIRITAKDIEARIAEQSAAMRYGLEQPAHRQEFVENLVRLELVSREAEKDGLLQDDSVKFAIKRALVLRFKKKFEETHAAPVPEADVRAYYDRHPEGFGRAARVHANALFLHGDDARARAKRVLARLDQGASFAQLARENSDDDSTRALGGDFGFKTREELSVYSSELADAAFALGAGELRREPVEARDGLYLVRVAEKQEAQLRPFDEVRASIAARLLSERIDAEYEAFVEKLRASAKVEVEDGAPQHRM